MTPHSSALLRQSFLFVSLFGLLVLLLAFRPFGIFPLLLASFFFSPTLSNGPTCCPPSQRRSFSPMESPFQRSSVSDDEEWCPLLLRPPVPHSNTHSRRGSWVRRTILFLVPRAAPLRLRFSFFLSRCVRRRTTAPYFSLARSPPRAL